MSVVERVLAEQLLPNQLLPNQLLPNQLLPGRSPLALVVDVLCPVDSHDAGS